MDLGKKRVERREGLVGTKGGKKGDVQYGLRFLFGVKPDSLREGDVERSLGNSVTPKISTT